MVANRGPATAAVTIVFVALASVFVAARFYTRAYLIRSVKQDDWWILAAWVAAVGFSVSICVGVEYGLGKHLTDIPDEHRDHLRKAQYAFSVLYNPCIMLTKTSIIVFYLSVMSRDVDAIFKWCNWICLAVVNVAGAALTLLNVFQCTNPIAAGYTYPVPKSASCTDIVTLYLSSAPVNISTDLALLFLPMPILTGLRLPKKQKIILLVTFGAGAFVAVVDVIRIAYLQEAAQDRFKQSDSGSRGPQTTESTDFPWYSSLSFMWSAIEVNIGIICACVPSLKPLFLKFMPSLVKDVNEVNEVSMNSSLDNENKENKALSSFNNDQNVITNPAAFRRPAVKEYSGDDDGDEMGFLNMLAGPEDDAPGAERLERMNTKLTRTNTANTAVSNFGFVKMDKSRNMLRLSNRQSLWPVAVVTVIFFLWGFAYGLLDTLNSQFQLVAKLSSRQSLGLHVAYYCGYFIAPLTLGRFILGRYGFKATMMVGLSVYGCGTLVFWPAAVLTSYPAFVFSNLIVGAGLSCLEVAANPYTALCGPLEWAEVRLNLSQAFQAVGTVCSPLLANRVLFNNLSNSPSLIDSQWAYLAISLFDFILAIIFYYIPLPEATDDQFEDQAERRYAAYNAKVGRFRVVWVTLTLGVFAQWCYVGAQEGVGTGSQTLLGLIRPKAHLDPFDWQTVGHTTFAAGRFLGAFLNYLFAPRWILLICFLGCIAFSAAQMETVGNTGAAISMMLYFFEGSIFPITYAISMRGMGRHTKWASAFMTSAISGGAVIPVIQWAVSRSRGLQYSYCVLVTFFALGSIFPIYLTLTPAARKQVDPVHDDGRKRSTRPRLSLTRTNSAAGREGSISQQFGLAGLIARKKHRSDVTSVQHVERSSQASSPAVDFAYVDSTGAREPSPAKLKGALKTTTRLATGSSRSGSSHTDKSNTSKTSMEKLEKVKQEKRPWTEEDNVRDEYHSALRGL